MGSSQVEAFYTKMNEVCFAEDYTYKDLEQQWNSQNFARKAKMRKALVSLLYKMSALPINFRFCLYYCGQINAYFDRQPPTLEKYLKQKQQR